MHEVDRRLRQMERKHRGSERDRLVREQRRKREELFRCEAALEEAINAACDRLDETGWPAAELYSVGWLGRKRAAIRVGVYHLSTNRKMYTQDDDRTLVPLGSMSLSEMRRLMPALQELAST